MAKVCVVGGAGFLGSHVADALSDAGYEVEIYDISPSPWIKPSQTMVIRDILDFDSLASSVKGSDYVYNFAGISDLNDAYKKPLATIELNILGNLRLLEICKQFNVRRYIYASTVYVNSREGGFYRCSKQAAENYIEEYSKVFGLEYTILRYGSLYGPRSNDRNGLYRIIRHALEYGIVQYTGSVDSRREYIHVKDAALASVDALNSLYKNESVVLTGQEPMLVKDLLEMISEILGENYKVEFKEDSQIGHYIRTPYAYLPRVGRKYIPPLHVDLGQGLLELIEEIFAELNQR